MKFLSLFDNDTDAGNNVDVADELAEFQDIQEHLNWKHPWYNNYYKAKDTGMKVMERRDDIIAFNICRKGNRCVIHFRKNKAGESFYKAFVRLVDDIKQCKDVDLFIKIVCD